jgi:hypothetical protein
MFTNGRRRIFPDLLIRLAPEGGGLGQTDFGGRNTPRRGGRRANSTRRLPGSEPQAEMYVTVLALYRSSPFPTPMTNIAFVPRRACTSS